MTNKDLVFNVAALRRFKKLTGTSPFMADMSDPDMYSALAYVGLCEGKYRGKEISQEVIDSELSYNDFVTVMQAFRDTISELGKLSEGEEAADEKKQM